MGGVVFALYNYAPFRAEGIGGSVANYGVDACRLFNVVGGEDGEAIGWHGEAERCACTRECGGVVFGCADELGVCRSHVGGVHRNGGLGSERGVDEGYSFLGACSHSSG